MTLAVFSGLYGALGIELRSLLGRHLANCTSSVAPQVYVIFFFFWFWFLNPYLAVFRDHVVPGMKPRVPACKACILASNPSPPALEYELLEYELLEYVVMVIIVNELGVP